MSDDKLAKAKAMADSGEPDKGLQALKSLAESNPDDAETLYELGNAYWKVQDWKGCLDCYTKAISLDPQSPAAEMRRMVQDIIQFYNKDMYNP